MDGTSLTGVRVLVVDNDPDTCELLFTALLLEGAEVTAVTSAPAALDALNRVCPDILISDLAMPDVDGYELIRRVRECAGSVPAIALSGCARAEDRQKALGAGFDLHLAKPAEPANIASAVARLVMRRRQGRLALSVGSVSSEHYAAAIRHFPSGPLIH